jgi:hypothetical protein
MHPLKERILELVRMIGRHDPELGYAIRAPAEIIFNGPDDPNYLNHVIEVLEKHTVLYALSELDG